jgi:hypothetical protein
MTEESYREFQALDLKTLNREELLKWKREVAKNDFDGMAFDENDYLSLMEEHTPWCEQPDEDLQASLREVQRDWLQNEVEQAEAKAGWDPNP